MFGILFSLVWILYFTSGSGHDTDTVLMDDCFEYVDDLRGDGLDDSMM